MKKVCLALVFYVLLLLPAHAKAEVKTLNYDTSVVMVFDFKSSYSYDEFVKFTMNSVSEQIGMDFFMIEGNGIRYIPSSNSKMFNKRQTMHFFIENNEETQTAVTNIAERFIKLFKNSGGSVRVIQSPVMQAHVYE